MAEPEHYVKVIAVDPGREKCGYAVVERQIEDSVPIAIVSGIVAPNEIGDVIAKQLTQNADIRVVAVGNGTNSAYVVSKIKARCTEIEVRVVDEHGTSEAARALSISRTPAQGLEKLLPNSLRSPKIAYDNVVAELIGRNFLESQQKNL